MQFIAPLLLFLLVFSSCAASQQRVGGVILREADQKMEQGIKEFNKRSFGTAENEFYRALRSYILIDDGHGQASAYLSLGSLYLMQADTVRALTMFEKARGISVERNDQPLIADALSALAGLYLLTGEPGKAREAIAQGLEVSTGAGFKKRKATLLNHRGNLKIKEGDYGEAEKILGESLSLNKKMGHQAGVAANYFNLGAAKLAAKDYDEADAYFQKALALDKDMERPDFIARDLEKCGEVSAIRGKKERALSCYRRAHQIYLYLKKNKEAERVSQKVKAIRE